MYWVAKKRKVWLAIHRKIHEIGHLCLNFINIYNQNMNGADIVDQLQNQYQPDHWMRNRKWWWTFLSEGSELQGRAHLKCNRVCMMSEEKGKQANAQR
jgi:hypothetical protein